MLLCWVLYEYKTKRQCQHQKILDFKYRDMAADCWGGRLMGKTQQQCHAGASAAIKDACGCAGCLQ